VNFPAVMASVFCWWMMLLSCSAPRALSFSFQRSRSVRFPRASGVMILSATNQDNGHDASRGRRDFLQHSLAQTMAVTTAVATTTAGLSLPYTIPMASAAAAMPKNSIQLPPMGLGAWAWGDSLFWGCKWQWYKVYTSRNIMLGYLLNLSRFLRRLEKR
jgi:hypothetical protein